MNPILILLPFAVLISACAGKPTKISKPKVKTTYRSPCLQISLQNTNSAFILGYGFGQSVAEAKQQSLYDIANQLEVNISGTSIVKTEKQNSQVSTKFSQNIKTKAQALLTSVEVACSDTNDPTGKYHFTLRYDQRPLADIFAEQLKQQNWQGSNGISNNNQYIAWEGPKMIVQSQFIQQIESRLLATPNKNNIKIKIQLFRKDQQWYLALNNIIKIVKGGDFKQLFNWKSLNSSNMQLSLENEFGQSLSNHMREGDEFRFVVTTKQQGFLSVFDIYEDGRVTKIRDNLPINNKQTLPEHKGSFSAGLLELGKSTNDHYIFIVTKDKIDSSAFHQLMLEDNNTNDHKNYYLNLFLYWLEKQPVVSSSSILVETIPR